MRKGTYILALVLGSPFRGRVGALGDVSLEEGTYCYVGSAMNGLDARVLRHLSKEKKLRWHIDYLTSAGAEVRAYVSYPEAVPECDLAAMAAGCGMMPALKGFGCSDCKCQTHLFIADGDSVARLAAKAGMVPFDP